MRPPTDAADTQAFCLGLALVGCGAFVAVVPLIVAVLAGLVAAHLFL